MTDQTEAARLMGLTPKDLAAELRSGIGSVDDATAELSWAFKHPMRREKQVSAIDSALTSDNLLRGLHSKNPSVRAVASQQRDILEKRRTELLAG